jgi:hypothetical protein
MRSGLFKLIREPFAAALAKSYPSFKLTEKEGRWWEWRSELASNLYFFIALQAFRDHDIFTVEIAWSDVDSFPYEALMKRLSPDNTRARERLGSIWRNAIEPGWSGRSPDWDLAPEMKATMDEYIRALAEDQPTRFPEPPSIDVVKARIPPLVNDALAKIDEYAMPIFREVARTRALVWKA